jgi:acetyl esterase/lipase
MAGSFLVGCIAAPFLAGHDGDQVVRKKVFQLLPALVQFLAFPALLIAMLTTIGFFLGSLVWCVTERRWIQLVCSGLLAVGFASGLLPAMRVASPGGRQGFTPPHPLGVEDYDQCAKMIETAGPPPERASWTDVEFKKLTDISYGPHGVDNRLDLYLPTEASGPMPVVVCIGGGWSERKEEFGEAPEWVVPLLRRGIAVAPVNFRGILVQDRSGVRWVPEHRFPVQIQDCKAAVRFLRTSADKYGLDPQQIGAFGHSCGSHLAALLGGATNVPEFEADGLNREVSSRVQAVAMSGSLVDIRTWAEQARSHLRCMNWPGSDYAFCDRSDGESSAIFQLLGGTVTEHPEAALKASPIHYVTKDHPPTFLVNGFRDGNTPPHQAEYYYCLLREAGVDSELMLIPGDFHQAAKRAGGPIAEFFLRHLSP